MGLDCWRVLPGAFDLKGAEVFAFAFGQWVFDDLVNAAAAWAFLERGAQFGETLLVAGYNDFNVAIFCVADPAFEGEFASFAMDEPAESNALDASAD
jgi:hypothetical protein